MFRHILRLLPGSALLGSVLVSGLAACGPESVQDEVVGEQMAALQGASLTVGETGVVEYAYYLPDGTQGPADGLPDGPIDLCTGTMIGKDAIVTAAHCFTFLGSGSTAWDGVWNFQIFYHHPKNGRVEVYNGPATWHAYRTYDSSEQGNAAAANSDIGLIVTQTPLSADYHDYMRLYWDASGPISGSLRAFGAGLFSESLPDDDHLRTAVYSVQSVTNDHVVVDQNEAEHVCHGDSGGPLVKYGTRAGASIPLLVGDLAQTEGLSGHPNCYNPAWWSDDSFYSKINTDKIRWIESHTGVNCTGHAGDLKYKRCFTLPFINDVSGGEGGPERKLATALYTVASG